jgi:Tat protein translocase TatB subunit
MFGIGMQELLIIAIVALLVVGPKKLPALAKTLGKSLSEFRKTADGLSDDLKDAVKPDDDAEAKPSPAASYYECKEEDGKSSDNTETNNSTETPSEETNTNSAETNTESTDTKIKTPPECFF